MNLRSHLDFAQTFVSESRKLVLELWQDDLEMELKGDSSPVTKLDRAIELKFRAEAERYFPKHAVLGEEFGLSGSEQEFLWVIDPIDGTQSLVNRVPTFGTFLALLHHGEPVLGIVDIPVLALSVAGAVGEGTVDEKGHRIDLSSTRPYTANDIVALGTPGSFARNGEQPVQAKLQSSFPTCRAYYDCFGHYLLGTGGVGALVEMNVPLWDVVAIEAIVRAAGGEVVVLRNNKQDLFSYRSSISGRKGVVDEVQRILNG